MPVMKEIAFCLPLTDMKNGLSAACMLSVLPFPAAVNFLNSIKRSQSRIQGMNSVRSTICASVSDLVRPSNPNVPQ